MQDKSKTKTMYKLVEQWQQSGISQKQFSEKNKIKLNTFLYWVQKFHESKTPDLGFAPLTITPEPLSGLSVPKIEIELTGGVIVRIY